MRVSLFKARDAVEMWTPAAFATSLNVAFDFSISGLYSVAERFLQEVQRPTAFAFCRCASKTLICANVCVYFWQRK